MPIAADEALDPRPVAFVIPYRDVPGVVCGLPNPAEPVLPPKRSVLIPPYNAEQVVALRGFGVLGGTIESPLLQTSPPAEPEPYEPAQDKVSWKVARLSNRSSTTETPKPGPSRRGARPAAPNRTSGEAMSSERRKVPKEPSRWR